MLTFQPTKIATYTLLLSLFFSGNVFSASDRIDYDLDNDGLIEINNLADLNEIRNNLDGKTLYGSNIGCPDTENGGCNGFELTTSLDFDTNQDGIINSNDDYWNENSDGIGEGWLPIGSELKSFSTVFDGNGFEIRNLYINRTTSNNIGLFSHTLNANIQNVVLTGSLMLVSGNDNAGSLIGRANDSNVSSCINTGVVMGNDAVGGLVGSSYLGHIRNSMNTGTVKGNKYIGGMVGFLGASEINNSMNTASTIGNKNVGGLVGGFNKRSNISNSYWAMKSQNQNNNVGDYLIQNTAGISLAKLQCATQASTSSSNSNCVSEDGSGENLYAPIILFNGWDQATDNDEPLWDFGTSTQLPALVLNGIVYRNTDGDSTLDKDDHFANNPAASIDSDNDGFPDRWDIGCDEICITNSGLAYDQFPLNNAAWEDDDLDGLPEYWRLGCDATCQASSNLTLDANPNDTDNDGLTNPNDDDDNGDGIVDADANSNGLIDINSLEQLNAIRYQLDGSGLRLTAEAMLNQSGCPNALYKGVIAPRCVGYELTTHLDFDTNQDGIMDSNDTYWNVNDNGIGEGWLPIGNFFPPAERSAFNAIFNGNGFEIRNLYINRPYSNYIGLFRFTDSAHIKNVIMSGSLMSITGKSVVGSLIGSATQSKISNTMNTGFIQGDTSVGGLVGTSHESKFNNIINTGAVQGDNNKTGALIGSSNSNQITNSISTGFVSGSSPIGGLISMSNKRDLITNSYWAINITGEKHINDQSYGIGYIGLTFKTLQCATQANTDSTNSSCFSPDNSIEDITSSAIIFRNWDKATWNSKPLWDFGAANQLPALVFNDIIYRDTDGDGSLDSQDKWPNNRAASIDIDNDGYPDRWTIGCDDACIANSGLVLDQLPFNNAAWQDTDLDGLPDSWAEHCDESCQASSLFPMDLHPNDTDNDGISNLDDSDDNGDGFLDADANSNGLIDIGSLAHLNAIRYQLDGSGLRLTPDAALNQSGCPIILYQGQMTHRCAGYELTNHLDFDTNQDGVIDANDTYWNADNNGVGKGWLPIGDYTRYSDDVPFSTIFNGNGFEIRNLYIDREDTIGVGLFSYAQNASIQNVVLTGPLMSLIGNDYTGALVGFADKTSIGNSINTGSITGANYTGGLVGYSQGISIKSSVNTGAIKGLYKIGGFVGYAKLSEISNIMNTGAVQGTSSIGGLAGGFTESKLSNGINTGYVKGESNVGSLIGSRRNRNTIVNSYWAVDSSGLKNSYPQSLNGAYSTLNLKSLQCATQANTDSKNSDCLDKYITIFKLWDQAELQGKPLWNFGTATQLPALVLNDVIYRDSDGDGSLDTIDDFPNNRAASVDTDNDGYPDRWTLGCDQSCIANSGLMYDQFPLNNAAWQDNDLDGQPDNWVSSCDSNCQNSSGLIIDANPNDTDNDGLTNQDDTDDNNDGIIDVDADSDGLIDIKSLMHLNAIRYQLNGSGLRLTSDAALDQSGCPATVFEGQVVFRCLGYELTTNLDFDTNQDEKISKSDEYWNANENGIGEGWLPIGRSNLPFSTLFNGNGFEIRNLYINRANTNYVGLFSRTKNATIQNLVLTGQLISLTGKDNVGALIGNAIKSQISNIINTAPVQGRNKVGGLVGNTDQSQINNSMNTGSVESDKYSGGLIGYSTSSQVSNSMNTGTIQSNHYSGGLIGYLLSSQASNSLSTGIVKSDTYSGGLVGRSISYQENLNTHWAVDSSGQTGSSGYSYNSGVTLATLQCATKANITSMNSNCVSWHGSKVLFSEWDKAVQDGKPLWDFGTNTQLPALVLNGIVYRDSDGDGSLDEYDDFPFDTDNDGLNNHEDTFPFIAIGNLLDTDNDGAPNTCEADCLALNMTADLDDDNDGVLDTVDAFPLDNTEHSDFDGDGIGDVADLDDDNDGVNDVDDPSLGEDNGKPEIINVPSIDPIAVTTENGDAFELLVDDNFLNAFTTVDVVDTSFTYEASLNGNVLAIDENDIMLIPAGRQAVQVVAIDTSGNRSKPVEMVAIVYPQVRFEQATSIIGENSTTNIKVSLTGDAPDYPVVINFAINELSDVNQADLDVGFDISAQHQVTIEAGDGEALNRDGFISIPIVDDNESENDELLIIDLVSAKLESETEDDIESLFVIKEDHKQHALTVTYQNLAPTVQLKLEQSGVEVTNVQQDGGLVSITATVQDGNGNDTHTFTWDLNSLGLNAPLANRLEFDPANVTANTYAINVTVTDSGVGQLTDQAVIRFDVIAPPVVVPPDVVDPKEADGTQASSGGGGGATSLWLMLLMFGIASGVRVRRVIR